MSKNGYWRYSDIIKKLKKECSEMDPVDIVQQRVDDEVIKYNHYVIEDGLHVYASSEKVVVSDEEIEWDEQGEAQGTPLFMIYDEDGVKCRYEDYGNEICVEMNFPNLKVYGKRRSNSSAMDSEYESLSGEWKSETAQGNFIPSAWLPDGNKGELRKGIIRGRNNVPGDIEEIIDINLIGISISPQMDSVYQRIKRWNDILKRHEDGEKIPDGEILAWLSLELNAYDRYLQELKTNSGGVKAQDLSEWTERIVNIGEDIKAIKREVRKIKSKSGLRQPAKTQDNGTDIMEEK